MIVIGGVELVTAADVRDRWGDVDAARLRDWCRTTKHREPLLRPVTKGELAELTGRPLHPTVDPSRPAQQPRPPGARGRPENLYRWTDVVEVEATVSARPAARPRRRVSR